MRELYQSSIYIWRYDFDRDGALVISQEDQGICSTAAMRLIRLPPEAVLRLKEILIKEVEDAGRHV